MKELRPVSLKPKAPTEKPTTPSLSKCKTLSPYKKYKRLNDRSSVQARLVQIGDRILMESKEGASEMQSCPGCKLLISVIPSEIKILLTYLEPAEFHSRHRLLDKD